VEHTLVWFRSDLRVADNAALYESACDGKVSACFVNTPEQWHAHDVGENRLAFLSRCVHHLGNDLAKLGIRLHIVDASTFDDVPQALLDLARKIDAGRIVCNAEYPLNERHRDDQVRNLARAANVQFEKHHGSVVAAPGTILTGKAQPFTVFTPFRRRWLQRIDQDQIDPLPVPAPQSTPLPPPDLPHSDLLADLWPGGEQTAIDRLDTFVDQHLEHYAEQRDLPALESTSSLSPYLSVGVLSPVQALRRMVDLNLFQMDTPHPWVNELIWREFYRHVIALFDHVSTGRAFKRQYDQLIWRHAPDDLAAWKAGRTGYPLVDAGMRQLNATGWMHNRVRMVSAMFLTKHLLIDWREGERYFMNKLVDGDFASNNGGWQWSASTGTDAAPYFRIFNPTTQAKRFDGDGSYVRRWVEEIDNPDVYPQPIVEHRFARQRALDHYAVVGRSR
jgi:deoxyribodipyrimidine photo-lyase